MGNRDDLAALDATGQADLVRRKDVKPIELVDAAIDRIERVNGALPSCEGPDNPARFPPITYGEYLHWWYDANYNAAVQKDVQ